MSVSALEAFLSTWSRARETFGEGVPQDGARFDNSAQFRRLEGDVESAAPSDWTGVGADTYAAENRTHAGALGATPRHWFRRTRSNCGRTQAY